MTIWLVLRNPVTYVLYYKGQFIFYIIHTVIMTSALVLAARKTDPREYDDGIDIFRGICEVIFFLFIIYNACAEANQFKR